MNNTGSVSYQTYQCKGCRIKLTPQQMKVESFPATDGVKRSYYSCPKCFRIFTEVKP